MGMQNSVTFISCDNVEHWKDGNVCVKKSVSRGTTLATTRTYVLIPDLIVFKTVL